MTKGRIVFITEESYLRHFEGPLREAQKRGFEVVFLFENHRGGPSTRVSRREEDFGILAKPATVLEIRASDKRIAWLGLMKGVRACGYAQFYLQESFDDATFLRARSWKATDPWFRSWIPKTRSEPIKLAIAKQAMRLVEAMAPVDPVIYETLADLKPDLALITPLIFRNTHWQLDYLKVCRGLGTPIVHPVFSWDNLSTKGTYLARPDRIWVWNQTQVSELQDLHGIPRDQVDVVGAYRFDGFRTLQAREDRKSLCSRFDFDPARKIVLFLGSSPLCAPEEDKFFSEWLRGLRGASDRTLAEANILVRPHPRNEASWAGKDERQLSDPLGRTRVQPLESLQRLDGIHHIEAQELFDTIHAADVVVGINTSAMLEASLLGKPVHCPGKDLDGGGQGGTFHFRHLADSKQGLLHLADGLPDHYQRLSSSLREAGPDPRTESFVRHFLFPFGEPASSRFVDLLEASLARFSRRARPLPTWRLRRLSSWLLRLAVLTGAIPLGSKKTLRMRRASL